MPRAMEKMLMAKADKMGLSKERKGAYVFGTMRKTGWRPSTQKKSKEEHAIYQGKKWKVKKMRLGGIVRQPTMALIGEAGPEAVMPVRRKKGLLGGAMMSMAQRKVARQPKVSRGFMGGIRGGMV